MNNNVINNIESHIANCIYRYSYFVIMYNGEKSKFVKRFLPQTVTTYAKPINIIVVIIVLLSPYLSIRAICNISHTITSDTASTNKLNTGIKTSINKIHE